MSGTSTGATGSSDSDVQAASWQLGTVLSVQVQCQKSTVELLTQVNAGVGGF